MSDIDKNEDNVDIPEAAPEDFSSQAAKRGLSPAVKFGIVIVGVFAIIGGALFIGGDNQADPTSNIRVDADLDATPGGDIQSESPRFQALLEQANEEASRAAIERQQSFIPTPESILQPIEDLQPGRVVEDAPAIEPVPEPVSEPEEVAEPSRPVITPPPAPAPAPAPRPTPAPAQPTTAEQQENPYTNSMVAQMGNLARTAGMFSDLKVQSVGGGQFDTRAADGDERVPSDGSGATSVVVEEVLIPAGNIIYAETRTSTNSDLPDGPVLVELTTGEYRGARLLGNFEVNEVSDRMVIEFHTMTFPDETSASISAYAVDGMTAETAVASSVDRRYLQRYGAILASSFITSFAAAKAEPEQTLTSIGDETAIIQERRDSEQSLYAGLSNAANAIGEDMIRSAPKGPRVNLKDGWPIAVLFMEPVTATN